MNKFENIKIPTIEEIILECDAISTNDELENFRIKYLGRKGIISNLFSNIHNYENKKEIGSYLNQLKEQIIKLIAQKKYDITYQWDPKCSCDNCKNLKAHLEYFYGNLIDIINMVDEIIKETENKYNIKI